MKKKIATCFLSIFIAICVLLVSGCSSVSDETLYKTGIEMTTLMGEMIKNSDYIDVVGLSSYSSAIENLYANDYDTPTRTYLIEVPSKEKILEMSTIDESEKVKELPDNLREQLLNSASFETIIVSLIFQNTDFNEHTICVAISTQRVMEGTLKKDVAYLYIFETGKPIIVYFRQIAKNVILASSYFIGKNVYETLSDTREIFEKLECTVTLYN